MRIPDCFAGLCLHRRFLRYNSFHALDGAHPGWTARVGATFSHKQNPCQHRALARPPCPSPVCRSNAWCHYKRKNGRGPKAPTIHSGLPGNILEFLVGVKNSDNLGLNPKPAFRVLIVCRIQCIHRAFHRVNVTAMADFFAGFLHHDDTVGHFESPAGPAFRMKDSLNQRNEYYQKKNPMSTLGAFLLTSD